MRALKFRVSRNSLERMYVSFIRPLLEYCDSVWDNSSSEMKKKLDAIHVEAARTITGATKLCSINKLLAYLGWEALQSRRDKHKLVIFYKTINGLTPEYLHELVPPLVQEASTYALRMLIISKQFMPVQTFIITPFSLPLSGHGILSLMKLNLHRTW